MKPRLFIAVLISSTMIVSVASAEEDYKPLKPKSTTTAWILGLDPIPGDALFYAGKPIQGTINLIIGGFAAYFLGWGIHQYATGSDTTDSWLSDKGEGGLAILGASIVFVPMLIWDGIGGIHGVYAHNKKVEAQKTAVWQRIQPTVAVSDDGFQAGLKWSF